MDRKQAILKRILCFSLVVIVIATILSIIFRKDSYSQKLNNLPENSGNNNIEMTVNIPQDKKWVEADSSVGAQYDFYIYNNSASEYKNWKITVDIPEGSYIDSSWNADYKIEGTKLIITAEAPEKTYDVDNTIMHSGAICQFGLIMYTPSDFNVSTGHIEGLFELSLKKSIPFIVSVSLGGIWILTFIVSLIISRNIKKFTERQERDKEIITQSITTFVNFIDAKDEYTRGHSNRVALYSKEIARRMGLTPDEQQQLYYVALMHDVGKIGIPDAILNKNGALTDEERDVIKGHTTKGGQMLKTFTSLYGIIEGALYHHERFDGKGYPTGLAGKNIPEYARIICIADSYDAMSSNRCYRKHLSKEVILSELNNNAGTQFDPDIVVYMIDMLTDGFAESVNPLN